MKTCKYSELTESALEQLLRRPQSDLEPLFEQVGPIVEAVRREGDEAVRRYTRKFDGVDPQPPVIDPSDAEAELPEKTREAIDTAFRNIWRFHRAQLAGDIKVETMPGVDCMRISRPIERVGLYVPGGTATLPSTLMMLGIPAALAGCEEIVIATPPRSDGSVAEEIRYIARKLGASVLLKAGGAQAVAAMAWGTERVPKVDKLFGPGNRYVTAAKMMLQNSDAQVAIDMPAGPSEVLVIADETAEPAFVAADLLSQAEHGADSQVVLVTLPGFGRSLFDEELARQLESLPRREIIAAAMEQSLVIEADVIEEAFAFSNAWAPEHLIVQCDDPERHLPRIRNAGSVFLGPWSPESAGDYASGTNHTLPTGGYARMYSGVSVDSFLKQITVQTLTREGLLNIAPAVEELARVEELEGHRRAVSLRRERIENTTDKNGEEAK